MEKNKKQRAAEGLKERQMERKEQMKERNL